MLTPFAGRQYTSKIGRNRPPLTTELREAIPWWTAVIGRLIPRRVSPPTTTPHPVVYTDAAGSGRLGAVVIYKGASSAFSTHMPDWFTANRGIYEFELAGVLFGLLAAMEIAYGAPMLLFFDNMGARGTII